MKNHLFLLVFACLTAGLAAPHAQQPAAGGRSRDLYVSVVDNKGVAVPGLQASDFTVREDGVTREVTRAVPATEPLSIMLLLDDSQASTASIPDMRDGVTHFVDLMKGKASIGIVTVGERPTSVAESTSDPAVLKKAIGRIFARPGSGAYLLEALVEVSKGFRKRDAQRPHIVALTVEAIEFSNQQHEAVLKELYASGATLHVLAIGTPATPASDEMRNRAVVMAEGTAQTGGRREQLLSSMAIKEHLTRLAGELQNQYVVTYGRPEALVPPEKVQVSVKKPGLTARARTRLADK
jgi:VWFA-related protein